MASVVQPAPDLGPSLDPSAPFDPALDLHRNLRHPTIRHRASLSKPPVLERPSDGAAFLLRGFLHRISPRLSYGRPDRIASTKRPLFAPADRNTLGGYSGTEMPGYSRDKKAVLSRLRRIEGQVRGIQKMVDDDRYCIEVLTQVNATRAALESVALQLLADHTEHCVTEAIQSGGGKTKVRELNEAVERLVRS